MHVYVERPHQQYVEVLFYNCHRSTEPIGRRLSSTILTRTQTTPLQVSTLHTNYKWLQMVCVIAFLAEMFQRLSQVLAVLTDPVARASYDRWQKAKLASRRRHEELTAKRRKLKEQLEERESQQASTSETVTEREAAASMKKEVSYISQVSPLCTVCGSTTDREAKRRDPAKDSGTNRITQTTDGQRRSATPHTLSPLQLVSQCISHSLCSVSSRGRGRRHNAYYQSNNLHVYI